MKGHLKQKTIIKRALAGSQAIASDPHMQRCPRCRKQAEAFQLLLAPSEKILEEPSPEVKARIEATRHHLTGVSTLVIKKPGRLILAGSTAALSVLLAVIIMLSTNKQPAHRHITATPLIGKVTVNGSTIDSLLVLGKNINTAAVRGAAMIKEKDSFSIILSQKSDFLIQGLQSIQSEYPLIMTLQKGSLTAEIIKRKDTFIFRTAQAKILITGTRFKLSAGSSTVLSLTEGTVLITALSSGYTRSLAAGSSCIITDGGTISLSPHEGTLIKNHKKIIQKEEDKEGSVTPKETRKYQKDKSKIHRERTELRKEMKEEQRHMREIKRSLRQRRNR